MSIIKVSTLIIEIFQAFKAKLTIESSIAAKSICIFTGKYFSKKNACLFFVRIFDPQNIFDSHNVSINTFNSSNNNLYNNLHHYENNNNKKEGKKNIAHIDYGYAKVFNKYAKKSNSQKFKLYKVIL